MKLLAHFFAKQLPPKRSADRLIGGSEDPYMLRWFLIPRNPLFNIYVHLYLRSDDDRALHDHPWLSLSYTVAGPYGEHYQTPTGIAYRQIRPGQWVWRSAKFAHRIELIDSSIARDVRGEKRGGPITLFITGPKVRAWGFHCPQGWRHWRKFTMGKHGEAVGQGCD